MSSVGPVSSTPRAGVHDRLVAAAERLFYADGIRAVGVDRLCAEAGVSKRSLYQHFTGKDAVVVAMLEARGAELRDRLVASPDLTPRERVLAVFDRTDEMSADPGFRGCPFVSAAVELKDPTHPGSLVAREHKTALTASFAALAREAGAADPDTLAVQLTLVFDGASAHAVVRGGSTPVTRQTVELLLDAHGV